jgi:hypothetical protein
MTLPTFAIVGAMKTGTTTLSEALAAHPEGFVPERKEVHFFEADRNWRNGVGWYEEIFAGAGDARAIGDATPLYMFYPQAVERMAQVIPDARLIACVRNPIDRAYSHYLHYFQRAARESRTFEQAVEDELSRPAERPQVTEGALEGDPRYLAQGRYAEQLVTLAEHFPREQIHVVLLEDLNERPQETFQAVCRHVGIDPEVLPENVGRTANAHIEFRPVWLWRRLKARGLVDKAPERMARFFVGRFMMREGVPYDPVAGPTRARLAEHFAPHNQALAEWLGRDLDHWR